ncbi:MAG: flagellar hook-associated protein FlgK [Pseudodesulfovibrio sp.]|uniref:Flagellar hook-associated protein 1 n=2 Tax=Pseudodesulfovibrio aespoeensis TaxID=182210 RepID=E6VTF2_PSEA9|nr:MULTISPECIES: flagellar hook-associated protein FlgK [Pseudodesulfovibrio]MBU4476575.1 flagellar hook-associated protein FlgK [Pseudomonadota bacterium]ADU62129.1 flagellar hook-associated protein FlgK [Pseudodesulfovibrio aespoeensis Aspo-2]MBU4515900.1 flagellar hook-associated protein FlgK [Pseudomonadota bacterium]MBU4522898.1 flagellar hook-associated protein FlgK [Pseudomonadota bacterium]MBU4560022.1 flagellar hook-associated protein FlgK [Pseudomonadota bacterium]
MLTSLYNLASSALKNAQVSINNASNNIANADTEGYQRTEAAYETSYSISIYGLSVGTGANITSIISLKDQFVEAQYLDASADLNRESAALTYLNQLDSLLNQAEGGLSETLTDFFDAWNALTTDPDSLSAREDLLGIAETLVYALNSTADGLETMEAAINTEIEDAVSSANQLIADIAVANASIAASPDNNQLISDRDQMIRELNAIIGVQTIEQENGMVTILTDEGYSLVDGTETHSLVYGDATATSALVRASDYDGELAYSGTSSEEVLLKFVSSGADGTAQFKASLDGGKTWITDENGETMLYIAGDEAAPVEIAGIEIWFEGGSADHAVGDTYTIVPKSGLYWEKSDGSLVNITPMTDSSGTAVNGRTSGGSLAGLFNVRDDVVTPTLDSLNDLSESIIWEVNAVHSTGAGLDHHETLTGSYTVEDSGALLSNSGLHFADNVTAGDFSLVTYDSDGNVSTSAIISFDPATDSLDDLMAEINTAFGGELTASINASGQFVLSAGSDTGFEIASDSTGLMAALGVNTFFSGIDADTIAIASAVAEDTSRINAGAVGSDGLVSSGNNDIATLLAALSDSKVGVGDKNTSLTSYLASLVAGVGAAASSAELKLTYAQTSVDYYYQQQASASEVNVDEELINLLKYQQAFKAAAEIMTVTRTMMDTVLDIV